MKYNEKVLRRVRILEEKNGIHYAGEDGKLYRTLRVLYTLVWIYTLGIQGLYLLGALLVYLEEGSPMLEWESVITVAVGTALMLVGYILLCIRQQMAAAVLSVLPEIILLYRFGTILRDESGLGVFGFRPIFFWRHLIPLAALILFMALMTAVSVRARLKTKRQYQKVLENLYALYHVEEAEELSEEQWDRFLEDYDPTDYKKLYRKSRSDREE